MLKYDRNILIDNIDQLRTNKNINKTQLAEIIGMSQPNLSKALNKKENKNFTIEQLIAIANCLDTSIDSLLVNHSNTSSTEIILTPRTIAHFISELIRNHDAKFASISVKETIYDVDFDPINYSPTCKIRDKNVSYPAIYFPSYWVVPSEPTPELDFNDINELQSEAYACGNTTRMYPVNIFLTRFKEIFDIYDKKGLSGETYETIIEDMLNRLRDE